MPNITLDTIITSELLAVLQTCPRCGFPRTRNYTNSNLGKGFQCGTWFFTCKDEKTLPIVSKTCLANEAAILRARVASLEAKVKRLIEAGDAVRNALNGFWNGTTRTTDTQANGALVEWSKAK